MTRTARMVLRCGRTPRVEQRPVMTVDVLSVIVIEAEPTRVADYSANPDNIPLWYVNIQSVGWVTPAIPNTLTITPLPRGFIWANISRVRLM